MAVTQENKAIYVVEDALRANPGSTVRQLTDITGLGKSTVGKQLVLLEAKGVATRSKADKRAPEVWTANAKRSLTKKDRLGKGELRELVLEHLHSNAGEA